MQALQVPEIGRPRGALRIVAGTREVALAEAGAALDHDDRRSVGRTVLRIAP